MSKIRVIDLLNKIANGEQPNHIKFKGEEWYWGYDSYIPKEFLKHTPDTQVGTSIFSRYRIEYCLNEEIEIIEEPKKIEKIDISTFPNHNNSLKKTAIKLNEIIDYINNGEENE